MRPSQLTPTAVTDANTAVHPECAVKSAARPVNTTVIRRFVRSFGRGAASVVMIAGLAVSFACNSGQKSAKSEEKQGSAAAPANTSQPQQTEYLTGRAAFQKLFVSARGFAPDVKPYRLESTYTKGAPVNKGESALWRGQFASPSRKAVKAYSWSGLSGPDAPERGVSHSTEDTYNPSNSTQAVFELPFLKIDTDQAFEEALKHGGSKAYKKDADDPVVFVLDFDQRDGKLLWHVIFGDNPNNAKLRIAVDASTGQYLRTEH